MRTETGTRFGSARSSSEGEPSRVRGTTVSGCWKMAFAELAIFEMLPLVLDRSLRTVS